MAATPLDSEGTHRVSESCKINLDKGHKVIINFMKITVFPFDLYVKVAQKHFFGESSPLLPTSVF